VEKNMQKVNTFYMENTRNENIAGSLPGHDARGAFLL